MRRKPQGIAQSSDIAFLLIIFFLLLSGLESSKALTLKSPQPIQATADVVSLALRQDGIVLYQGKQLSRNQLQLLLSTAKQTDITVDEQTSWQDVVDLLSVANRMGTEVSIHAP
ncbi:MAG: biopolymer transporter ExbD [Sphaerochaetaceae bacterium]